MRVEAVQEGSRRTHVALAVLLVAVALSCAGAAFLLYALNPVAEERVCQQGFAPATNAQGGSDCFRHGSRLPGGWTWDPRGNRLIN